MNESPEMPEVVSEGEPLPVPVSDTQPGVGIGSDAVIELAKRGDARIAAIKKIRQQALMVTTPNDWVDIEGKPYPGISGCQKVARLFGVSWQVKQQPTETGADGHRMYKYQGQFNLAGMSPVNALGRRSSKDPWYSMAHGKPVPVEQIDMANVEKAAFTNCVGNGIKALLGLGGLTWEEVNGAGIVAGAKVRFKGKGKEGAAGKGQDRKSDEPKVSANDMTQFIGDALLDMNDGDPDQASRHLAEITTFKGRDGEEVPGIDTLKNLTGRRLEVTYDKVRKLAQEAKK